MSVTVTMEVNYCSLCPYCKVNGPIWNRDYQEDVYDIICNMLHETVYENLSWYETASKCESGKGWDTPPEKCPFNQSQDEVEKPEDVIKLSNLI